MIYDNIILIEYTIIYDRYGSADFFFIIHVHLAPKAFTCITEVLRPNLKNLCMMRFGCCFIIEEKLPCT